MSPAFTTVDQKKLEDFCHEHGIAKLSVFGSILREDFDPNRSDIDILVEFEPRARKSLFKILLMQDVLSEMFGRNVDLTTPGSLSKYFRDDVLAAAVVLYDAA